MRLKDVKPGRFYETKMGIGMAIRAGGTHPPSIKMSFQKIGAGVFYLSPRDVLREIEQPASVASAVGLRVALCQCLTPGGCPLCGGSEAVADDDPEKDERLTRKAADVVKGAETLQRVIEMTCDWLKDICKLNAMGFELTATVGDDGFLHLEKQG